MPRKSPTMAEKLGSALLELQRLRGDPIDREHAKMMHAEQICSLFQFDHAAGYACHGVGNHPAMLTPLFIAVHREKTAKIDVPAIAKGKRVAGGHETFRARVLAKGEQQEAPRRTKKGNRPMPGGRGDRRKVCVDGRVVDRETGELIR